MICKFLWKIFGFAGNGSGEALNTAASTERLTASSPLQLPMLTSTTSPLGNCFTLTMHSSCSGADAGRMKFLVIFC